VVCGCDGKVKRRGLGLTPQKAAQWINGLRVGTANSVVKVFHVEHLALGDPRTPAAVVRKRCRTERRLFMVVVARSLLRVTLVNDLWVIKRDALGQVFGT
jgi:hypothetical protein